MPERGREKGLSECGQRQLFSGVSGSGESHISLTEFGDIPFGDSLLGSVVGSCSNKAETTTATATKYRVLRERSSYEMAAPKRGVRLVEADLRDQAGPKESFERQMEFHARFAALCVRLDTG